jgi:tetratricopeptide (TPR) repeat protein
MVSGDQLADAIQLIQKGEWKKAEAALNQSPSDQAATLYWKGYVLFRTGRFSESASTVSQYLEQKPDSAAGRKVLGLCRFMQGRPADAERELRQATELDPSDSEALYYLGRLYFTRQDLPAALRTFEKVVRIDSSSVRGYNHLGQTLEALSRFDDARAAYKKSIEIEQTHTVKSEWPYFNLGVLSLKDGHTQEAIGLFREALARNADWPEARIQLAVALSSSGQLEEARLLLARVLEVDPKNADAHYQMGRLLLKLGEREQARSHLRRFESLRRQH